MTQTADEALIEHIAENLYWHRFSDPRLRRSEGWGDCKLKQPSFAACYIETAAAALHAIRSFNPN
jgi:hypothetical protein